MNKYWLITDTHFSHKMLEELNCRSGDWEERILFGISKIPKSDVLIHLGDFCIGNELENSARFFSHAPDTTILVRGNHDKKSMTWYLEHGWSFVVDELALECNGEKVVLSHRPVRPDHSRYTRNVHGHTHGNMHRAEEFEGFYSYEYHIDICPEFMGYNPLRLDTLLLTWKPVCHANTY